MKTIKLFAIILLTAPMLYAQQNVKQALSPIKFEYLRINVPDKEATARWYVENVDLKIIPSKSSEYIYIADKDNNFMIELSSIAGLKNTYWDIHIDGFHLAFEGHKKIKDVSEKMLANGAKQEGALYQNLIGDYVMNVRDPNGFTSQLIHRVNPFFEKPLKSPVRFEHFAYNTPDQKITSLWLVEFMELNIPWSKDIDTTKNNYRNYRVPYVGDSSRGMSLELFGKKDVDMTFAKMKHDEVHLGFSTNSPEQLAKQMVYGGARIVNELKKLPNGDLVIDLVDPSGFPIRLIKRKKMILK